jgi:hypothetical protein
MTRGKAYAALALGLFLIATCLFNLISGVMTGRLDLPRSSGNVLDVGPQAGSTEYGLAALYNLFAVAVGVGCLFAFIAWWVGRDDKAAEAEDANSLARDDVADG